MNLAKMKCLKPGKSTLQSSENENMELNKNNPTCIASNT